MKRSLFLITGCGFIGFNLAKNLNLKNFQLNLIGKKRDIKFKKIIKISKFDVFNIKKYNNLNFHKSFVILSLLGTKNKNFKVRFLKLIKFFSQKDIKKIILLSSVSVYGNSYPKISPLNDYAKKCIYSENIIKKFFKSYLILRVTNLFGQNKKNPSTIEKLVMTNLNIKKFSFQNENITRSYLSIDEFSLIIKKVILKNLKGIYDVSNKNYVFSFKKLKEIFKSFYKNKIKYKTSNTKPLIMKSIIKSSKLFKKINHKNRKNFLYDLKKINYYYKNFS